MVTDILALHRGRLQQGLTALPLQLSDETQEKLLQYLYLLEKWNRTYNLTAVREINQMIPKHLLDSLAIMPWVQPQRILDVGTGAGLPGVVLALTQPTWHWVLLDSNAKKIRFIQQVIIELGLKNVETVCARLEHYQPTQPYDSIMSRAFAELATFYHLSMKWCAPEGCLLAMKGVYPEQELTALHHFPVEITTYPLTIPQLAAQRHLVMMRAI
jgi:16S rRNA (guanine527-N7)-methyltransferase